MKGIRIIAFGDIHGCYKAAETAVKLAKDENALAIFLGDYVDRGPDSIKTLEALIEAKKQNPEWIFLRGNHDQMLLDLISGKTEPNIEFKVPNGMSSNEETTKLFFKWKKLSEHLKNEIVQFLERTKFYYETEHWIFVHALLKDSTITLDKKSEEDLIWNYSLEPIWEGKTFIHGHSTVKVINRINKGININTMCGYGGVLSGVVIEKEGKISQIFSIMENGEIKNTKHIKIVALD